MSNNNYTIDFETTGLPTGLSQSYDSLGKTQKLNPVDAFLRFGDIDVTQYSHYDAESKRIKHYSVGFNTNRRMPNNLVAGSKHERYIKDIGKVNAYVVNAHNEKDALDVLTSPWSKMKGGKLDWYKKSILSSEVSKGKSIMLEIMTDEGRTWMSEGAFLMGKNSGEFKSENGKITKSYSTIENLIKGSPDGKTKASAGANKIDTARLSYEEFQQLLKKNTVDMLSKATKAKPLMMEGWNPFYDIHVYMSELSKMGAADIAEDLYKSWQQGIIQTSELERTYKAFMFQLSKENKELGQLFRIPFNPVAAAATGRPGQIAKTFNEQQYVPGFSAEKVTELVKKHFSKDLKGLELEQLHTAGTDVFTEREVSKVLANKLAQAGLDVEGIIRGDTHGNLSKLLESEGSLSNIVKEKTRELKAFETYNKYPSMFASIDKTKNFKSLLTKQTALKWGGIAGIAALGFLATFGLGGGEESLYPFSDKMKVLDLGLPQQKKYNNYFEDNPNTYSQIGTLLGAGVLAPMATLYGVGAYSKLTNPKNLGVTPKIEANFKNIFGTMYKGLAQLESSHPILRVLQMRATTDYIVGRTKPVRLKTINNGSVVERYTQNVRGKSYGHNFEYRNLLNDAEKLIPKSEYELLKEAFEPKDYDATKILNREIRIQNIPGKGTMVFVGDLDSKGLVASSKYNKMKTSIEGVSELAAGEIFIPAQINFDQQRQTNLNMAKAHQRMTTPEYGDRHPSNRFVYNDTQRNMIKHGDTAWSNRKDFIARSVKPKYLPNGELAESVWKGWRGFVHWAEIMPKGVGQAHNEAMLKAANYSANTQTIGRMGTIRLPGHEKENFKRYFEKISSIGRGHAVERINTFMESPFELGLFGLDGNKVDKISNNLKSSGNLVKGIAGRVLGIVNRPHLGLASYNYNMGVAEYVGKFAMKRILPAMVGWEALRFVDHALGSLTQSPTGRGPIFGAPIAAYQGLTLLHSKISDLTGFTSLTKKQEQYAPGSTGLGVLAPALSALTTFKLGQYMYNKGPTVFKDTIDVAGARLAKTQFIASALRPEAYKGALGRSAVESFASWAIKNPKSAIFSAMMLPMVPFLPGVLGSNKTYAEKKAEFKGQKEVAIRKYRGWLLSSSSYSGGKPIQFRKHMTNIIMSDYENRGVLYPNYWERFAHNATLGLYKPYILENYHKDSQPVYESAAYGAHIPLIGQLIAGTIGKVIKPTVTYHEPGESSGGAQGQPMIPFQPNASNQQRNSIIASQGSLELAKTIGLQSEGGSGALTDKWSRQYHDLIGFTGFTYETVKQAITGQQDNFFTPYKESAGEMYNPAQQMWGWHLGDITAVGGEFLRRIFPFPAKNWKVNDIPNELNGVSWIPQEKTNKDAFNKYSKDITHGTSFDDQPLGWLYSTRKGWENLYPEIRGKDLEQYPDPVRLEILQSVAPFTEEFRDTSRKVMKEALGNSITLEDEQRFYETLDQVRQLKDQLYANRSEYGYELETESRNGTVAQLGEDGSFMLAGDKRQYQLAGVSIAEADIRANLLQKRQFKTTEDLAQATNTIRQRSMEIIASKLSPGNRIEFDMPQADQIANTGTGIETIVGDLNDELIEAGAPVTNTGNLSSFNMQQKRLGPMGVALSKYWGGLTDDQSFFNKKLISNRDYMSNYLSNNVFNREVKLWTHPIEQLLKPAIASFAHEWLGVDSVPGFTVERRKKQEYWDIIKYVKFKMLAVEASKTGNEEDALYYHNMWRSTMIGSDPTDDNPRDEISALPQNEKAYYSRFANEPDPEKRGEIMKYLPRAAKRIYSAIWEKKIAEASNDSEVLENWENLKETEGWGITKDERKMYMNETGGNSDMADWIRARYIREYMKKNALPDTDSLVWSPNVDMENVELLSLKDQGENVQDYGFFDDKIRVSAFDGPANAAALQLRSIGPTSKSTMNQIVSYIIQDDRNSEIANMPTMSTNPIMNANVQTNGHSQYLAKSQNRYAELLTEAFNYSY